LGATALKACGQIEAHTLDLKTSVRTSNVWLNRILIPAYHPGQRAMIHRSFPNQLSDYQFIAEKIRRLEKKQKKSLSSKTTRRTRELVDEITARSPDLSYFALHKLFFMIEAKALDEFGERLTDSYIIRQKDGPYCVELHVQKLMQWPLNLTTYTNSGQLYVRRNSQPKLFSEDRNLIGFNEAELHLIDVVMGKYAGLSDVELKRAAYSTTVMRTILRKEKNLRLNLFNAPLMVPASFSK
jgi:hypothetical protein